MPAQRRRVARRGLQRREPAPRDAGHPDRARAPRLLGEPGDHGVDVLAPPARSTRRRSARRSRRCRAGRSARPRSRARRGSGSAACRPRRCRRPCGRGRRPGSRAPGRARRPRAARRARRAGCRRGAGSTGARRSGPGAGGRFGSARSCCAARGARILTHPTCGRKFHQLKLRSARSPAGLDILGLFSRDLPELTQTEISARSDSRCRPSTASPPCSPSAATSTATRARAASGSGSRSPASCRRCCPGCGCRRSRAGTSSQLAADTGETVNLALLQDDEIVYLLSESGDRLLSAQTPVGMRLPAHCTALGKCLLAQLPDETARDMLGARAVGGAHAGDRDDVGGARADARARSAATASRSPGRSTRSGWPRSPCRCTGSATPPRSTSRSPRRARRARSGSSWSGACATPPRRIEASLAAHGH